MRKIETVLVLLSVLLCAAVQGQSQGPSTADWQGELRTPQGQAPSGYVVELYDVHSHQKFATADVLPDGSFECRDVPFGDYQVQLNDSDGRTVYQSMVTIANSVRKFDATVPEPKIERPPSGGVSMRELLHPPDKKAVQYAVKAAKLSQAGDHAKAAEDLEKAVRLDPAYAGAHINLGVQYVHLGRFEESLSEFSRATELDGPNAVALCNMAYAEMRLRRYGEALLNLRASLQVDSSRAQTHYLLGTLLAADPAHRDEAVGHLKMAARSLPSAQAVLDHVSADSDRR